MENGILLPTLQSALPFLDLHGTPRLEFHQSVFDELREKLMEQVAVIAEGKEEDRCVMDWFLLRLGLVRCEGTRLYILMCFVCCILSTDMGNLKSYWRRAFPLSRCHPFSR